MRKIKFNKDQWKELKDYQAELVLILGCKLPLSSVVFYKANNVNKAWDLANLFRKHHPDLGINNADRSYFVPPKTPYSYNGEVRNKPKRKKHSRMYPPTSSTM